MCSDRSLGRLEVNYRRSISKMIRDFVLGGGLGAPVVHLMHVESIFAEILPPLLVDCILRAQVVDVYRKLLASPVCPVFGLLNVGDLSKNEFERILMTDAAS